MRIVHDVLYGIESRLDIVKRQIMLNTEVKHIDIIIERLQSTIDNHGIEQIAVMLNETY